MTHCQFLHSVLVDLHFLLKAHTHTHTHTLRPAVAPMRMNGNNPHGFTPKLHSTADLCMFLHVTSMSAS